VDRRRRSGRRCRGCGLGGHDAENERRRQRHRYRPHCPRSRSAQEEQPRQGHGTTSETQPASAFPTSITGTVNPSKDNGSKVLLKSGPEFRTRIATHRSYGEEIALRARRSRKSPAQRPAIGRPPDRERRAPPGQSADRVKHSPARGLPNIGSGTTMRTSTRPRPTKFPPGTEPRQRDDPLESHRPSFRRLALLFDRVRRGLPTQVRLWRRRVYSPPPTEPVRTNLRPEPVGAIVTRVRDRSSPWPRPPAACDAPTSNTCSGGLDVEAAGGPTGRRVR
jgi:hypothetical protein